MGVWSSSVRSLDSAPLLVVVLAQVLDDLDDPSARLDALPSQLLERLGRGIARLVGGSAPASGTSISLVQPLLGCPGASLVSLATTTRSRGAAAHLATTL